MELVCSSKRLPQAEEEVDVRRLAQIGRRLVTGKSVGFADGVGIAVVDVHREDGRIQVIAEIEPDGPDRRVVAQTGAQSMREVVEAAQALLAG